MEKIHYSIIHILFFGLEGIKCIIQNQSIIIKFFDKFGNPAEKPVVKKEIPSGVTAQSVLKRYLEVIGGEKEIKAVKKVYTIASGSAQGMPLELHVKTTNNKMAVDMLAMGMPMMKQVVNEKGAYMVQQGQRKDFSGDDLKKLQAAAGTFKELKLLENKEIALKGIESIKDKDAYAVQLGNTTYYYDTLTGFKVAEARELEQMGQKMTQMTYFEDYKEVKGLKFPYKIILSVGMDLEFTTSEVKINEGVTDKDFE